MLSQSEFPGIINTEMTGTVVVNYGYGSSFKWVGPPAPVYKKIGRALPKMKIKSYTPVKWQSNDFLNHYIVFRHPKADEITCKWKNTQTGEILYPYNILIYQN